MRWHGQEIVSSAIVPDRIWFDPRLTKEDKEWLRRHFELAEAKIPIVDMSWITTTPLWGS